MADAAYYQEYALSVVSTRLVRTTNYLSTMFLFLSFLLNDVERPRNIKCKQGGI